MTHTAIHAAPDTEVERHAQGFTVELDDGRALIVPWSVAAPLAAASARDLYACALTADRTEVVWPRLGFRLRLAYLTALADAAGSTRHLPTPVLLPPGHNRARPDPPLKAKTERPPSRRSVPAR